MSQVSRKNTDNDIKSVTKRKRGRRRKNDISNTSSDHDDPDTRFPDEEEKSGQSDKDNEHRSDTKKKHRRAQSKAINKGNNGELKNRNRPEISDGKHEKNILYKCPDCDSHFLTKKSTVMHRVTCRLQIKGKRTKTCPYCKLKFSTVTLGTHMHLHHIEQNLSLGDFEIVVVSHKRPLIATYRTKEGISRAPLFKCKDCDAHYLSKNTLNKHVREKRHHDKLVTCETCSITFTAHTHTKHVKIHHHCLGLRRENFDIYVRQNYQYERKDCDASGRNDLENDQSKGEDSNDGIDVRDKNRPEISDGKSKEHILYKCSDCDLHFKNKHQLYVHRRPFMHHKKQKLAVHDINIVLLGNRKLTITTKRIKKANSHFVAISGLHPDEDDASGSSRKSPVLNKIERTMTENVRCYLGRKTVRKLAETSHQPLENLIPPHNCVSEIVVDRNEVRNELPQSSLQLFENLTPPHNGVLEILDDGFEDLTVVRQSASPEHMRCRDVIDSTTIENVKRDLERKSVHTNVDEMPETSDQSTENVNLITPHNCVGQSVAGCEGLSVRTEMTDEDTTDDDNENEKNYDFRYEVKGEEDYNIEIDDGLFHVHDIDEINKDEIDVPNGNGPVTMTFKVEDSGQVLAHSQGTLEKRSMSADNNDVSIKIKNTFSITSKETERSAADNEIQQLLKQFHK